MHITFRPQIPARTAVHALIAAAGIAALGQLASTPIARADDFTDILNDEVAVIDAGYADLASAAKDFAGADFPDGLEQSLWGIDDFLISPEELAVIGGVDALTGSPLSLQWTSSSALTAALRWIWPRLSPTCKGPSG